jgi:hypothetical protein
MTPTNNGDQKVSNPFSSPEKGYEITFEGMEDTANEDNESVEKGSPEL